MGDGATLIVVPVLGRPGRVAPFLASLAANTPEPHRVLFMLTDGDTEELAAVRRMMFGPAITSRSIPWAEGDFARKVNTAYRESDEPFLFVCGDDVQFHPGWLTAALEPMTDPAVAVVGTQDLGNPRVVEGTHATHWLIRRAYVDDPGGTMDGGPGVMLHEGYCHNFVDDELIGTAKARGVWAFAPDSVVEHLHPNWGKGSMDGTYSIARRRQNRDRALHTQRRHLWT